MALAEAKPSVGEAHALLSPGELVLKKIFAEFVVLSGQKLQFIASQTLVSPFEQDLAYRHTLAAGPSCMIHTACIVIFLRPLTHRTSPWARLYKGGKTRTSIRYVGQRWLLDV